MGWCTYFSVPPNKDTVNQLVELQTCIKQYVDPDFSSQPADKLHLTLLFLGTFLKKEGRENADGDAEYEKTEKYQTELAEWKAKIDAILAKGDCELAFTKPTIERLPQNPKEPENKNLIVVKLQPTEKSKALYEALYAEFLDGKEVDFKVFRDWKPHFTLGKLSLTDVELSSLEAELAKSPLQEFKADSFYLAGQGTKPTWSV